MNITVVIPSYKVKKHIEKVVKTLPDFVRNIIIIDDKCPQESGKYIESLNLEKVTVVYHQVNLGVGGAIVTGYKKALELDSDIVVKVDGDGQMDPSCMEELIQPIVNGTADYAKGNRFSDFKALRQML